MTYTVTFNFALPEGTTATDAAEWDAIRDLHYPESLRTNLDDDFVNNNDRVSVNHEYNSDHVIATIVWTSEAASDAYHDGLDAEFANAHIAVANAGITLTITHNNT